MLRCVLVLACTGVLCGILGAAEPVEADWAPPTKHWRTVDSVSWSPDGSTLASGGLDGQLAFWDAKTGRKMRSISSLPLGSSSQPVWSGDCKRILTVTTSNYKSTVWDTTTGKHFRTLRDYQLGIRCGCLNLDGTRAYFGCFSGKIQIWDPVTGEVMNPLEGGHTKSITAIACSPDGTLVSASEDKTAIIWDLATGKPRHTLKDHKEIVASVAISKDGKTVVTGSRDNTAIVWDAKTGEKKATITDHGTWVTVVSVSDDGAVVLSSDRGKNAIWERSTGKSRVINLGSYPSCVVSGDGTRIASAIKNEIQLWDVKTGDKLPTQFGSTAAVLHASWHPKDQQLFVGQADNTAVLVGADGKFTPLPDHAGSPSSSSWSSDGSVILTGDHGGTAALWDTKTAQLQKTFRGDLGEVAAVSLLGDGSRVAVASKGNKASVYDAKNPEKAQFTLGTGYFVTTAAWSPDGSRILTGAQKSIRIWDAKTGEHKVGMEPSLGNVNCAAWSHDGTRILASYSLFDSSIVHIWDADAGKRTRTFEGHLAGVTCVCWNPDSTRIASGSHDTTVIIRDAKTGDVQHTLKGHTMPVTSVSWSHNGNWLASTSYDGTTRLWDTKTGKELCRVVIFNAGKDWLVLTPEGEYDGTEAAANQSLYLTRGTHNAVAKDKYLKKSVPGLLKQLLTK